MREFEFDERETAETRSDRYLFRVIYSPTFMRSWTFNNRRFSRLVTIAEILGDRILLAAPVNGVSIETPGLPNRIHFLIDCLA